jgi:predicted 3-demethylubiquinone-9 3-methyltransferase (glyoxalase superfamily)
MDKVSTWIWAGADAEERARFYVALLPDSAVDEINRAPADYPGGKAGDVLTVSFTLAGRSFALLNGGPGPEPSTAMSLQVDCADQAEVDRLWAALSADPAFEMCGWCRDRWGLHWQIVPRRLSELMADPDRARAGRAMRAMMGMGKIDIAALDQAADADG